MNGVNAVIKGGVGRGLDCCFSRLQKQGLASKVLPDDAVFGKGSELESDARKQLKEENRYVHACAHAEY